FLMKTGYNFKHLFLGILLLFSSFLHSTDEPSKVLSFRGHLGKSQMSNIAKILDELQDQELSSLVIEIDSTSGDIKEVLNIAKEIYRLKTEKKLLVIAYIEDNAIGPAAVLPFLSDKLYISYLVAWGDIPLGTDEALPTNLLKSRVTSLISADHPKADLLKKIATAMSDPGLVVINENDLQLKVDGKGDPAYTISTDEETLVLNHNELSQLNLIENTLPINAFRKQIEISEEDKESIDKAPTPIIDKQAFEEQLEEHITYDPNEETLIGHILIDDRKQGINQSTWIYVKTALDYYKELKPAFIILELNTPGGEVFSSQNISDALQDIDLQNNIPVIAFIDNWAISAGAMLAYSCRFITTTKDGSMGAAEPVIMGEGGQMQSASEKVNSALRTDFANRARFFDRNSDIAEAMVDKDIILVLRHGKVIRLDNEDQIRLKGPNPDRIITNKGKLLTLNAEEMIDYGVADMVVQPAKLDQVSGEELNVGKWSFNKELLSKISYLNEIPNAKIDAYRMDWRTKFFAILSMPIVSSILMLGLLLGFYIEFNTPGFGLPGAVGLTCLVLIIMANLSLDIANWLEVILMLVGLTLIAVELSLLPTGGILGFVGALFFVGGLFAIMLPGIDKVDFEFDTQTFNAAGEEFFRRLAWMCGTLVVGFVLIVFLSRYISPNLAGLNRLVLAGHEQEASEGFVSGEDPDDLPKPGTKGEVLATLRPAGKIIVDDAIYEAVTAGSFIEKGEKVIIDRIDGNVIVVNKISGEEGTV
ncbi:MAG: NfeD family protein, partial [Chlamydiota bacterium]